MIVVWESLSIRLPDGRIVSGSYSCSDKIVTVDGSQWQITTAWQLYSERLGDHHAPRIGSRRKTQRSRLANLRA